MARMPFPAHISIISDTLKELRKNQLMSHAFSYLLNQSTTNMTLSEKMDDISTHTVLVENDPAMEGAGDLFEEFTDLLNQHPHSSDVFELVER